VFPAFNRKLFKRRGHRNATLRPQRDAVNNLPFACISSAFYSAVKKTSRFEVLFLNAVKRRELSETFHRKFIWPLHAPFFIQTPHIK
jgi:hypothetical protein